MADHEPRELSDWIAWTKCPTCAHSAKDIFQTSDDAPRLTAGPSVRCPNCGSPARYIAFPAFEVQVIEISPPGDAMYDTLDDW